MAKSQVPREEESTTYSQIMEKKIQSIEDDAKQLMLNDEPALAVKRLSRGLVLQPRNPSLYQQRAEGYMAMGDFSSAIQNLKKALTLTQTENMEIKDKLVSLYESYGDIFYKQHNYNLAIENYQKAIDLQPDQRRYKVKRISCLLHLKDYKQCLSLVENELQSGSPTIELLLMRARLYLVFGNVSKCYHDVECALEIDSENSDALELIQELKTRSDHGKNQAIGFSLVGKREEAVREMNSVIESDPHTAHHHIFRGAIHRQNGSYSSAVDDFLLAMNKCGHQYDNEVYKQASRQLVLTYNDFAVECFRRGLYNDAIVLLNKAIREEKNDPELYTNRGDCFFKLQEYRFALADYQLSHTLQQDIRKERVQDMEIDYRLAVVYYTLGMRTFSECKFSAAEEYFTNAISHSPYTARYYMCRARTRYELKNISEAKNDTLKALLLDTTSEDCLPLVGRLFPGRSPVELVNSDLAQRMKHSLIIPKSNELIENDQEVTKDDKYISEILAGIHVSELSEDTVMLRTESTVKSLQGDKQEYPQEEEEVISPRPWTVLEKPVPSSSTSNLRYCMQENDFYSLIYYTKKSIKDEIHQLLETTNSYPSRTMIGRNKHQK